MIIYMSDMTVRPSPAYSAGDCILFIGSRMEEYPRSRRSRLLQAGRVML